jgi:4-hydroxy-tetrahydrodipicolinate synthase
MNSSPKGVIAAVITPVDDRFYPDHERLVARCRYLLANGCDGINLLGTTGEATSFSLEQRLGIMRAIARSGLAMERFMVGTGAASVSDAVTLSRHAGELGFSAALLLPPFYYKPVSEDGLIHFVGAVVSATAGSELPVFLYNFPAQTGITYTVGITSALLAHFGTRIAGLKDSSGDIAYAENIAALAAHLKVFPSNEAVLLRAREEGIFAGCISATANINHADCALAYHSGDTRALARAIAIRTAFSGLPLVPGIKQTLADQYADPVLANLVPPLSPLASAEAALLRERLQSAQQVCDADASGHADHRASS